MKPCPDTFPFPLVALDETASTNQYLSQLCNQLQESVAELTTVTAEFQSNMRRSQRTVFLPSPGMYQNKEARQHLGS